MIEVEAQFDGERWPREESRPKIDDAGELVLGRLATSEFLVKDNSCERVATSVKEFVSRAVGKLLMIRAVELLGTPTVLQMARGGNFKVTRMNIQNSGKANSKQAMPPEQKRARRRKRKKK